MYIRENSQQSGLELGGLATQRVPGAADDAWYDGVKRNNDTVTWIAS